MGNVTLLLFAELTEQQRRHFLAKPHPRRRRGTELCTEHGCLKLRLADSPHCAHHTDLLVTMPKGIR